MNTSIEFEMGAENQAIAKTKVHCGACQHDNLAEAKFCEGCGHALYEPCTGCSRPVLLNQKFCGDCGADLVKSRQARYDQHESRMVQAVALVKESDFDRAIGILQPISQLQDFRFKVLADNSRQAIAKIEGLRERANQHLQQTLLAVKQELVNDNHLAALRLLESVPAKMLNEDAKRVLARMKTFTDQFAELDRAIKAAIVNKNWPLLGGLVDQMLDLAPKEKQYQQLGVQVAEKLTEAARQALSKANYASASDLLDAVPTVGRTKEFHHFRASVEDVRWLSHQFESEPYASPMLGRLAVRFAKEVPEDPHARAAVKQLAASLKQGERAPRMHLPTWKGTTESWMGGRAGLLALPTSIDLGEHALLRTAAGRFSVAIGLALQGLGMGRVRDHFGPKQGLLRGLARRKKTLCWGIDLGAAALKAVCLEQRGDGVAVTACYHEEYESPLCRASFQGEKSAVIRPVVENFLAQHPIDDIPLWGNVSGTHLISRFVRLPNLKDKQAAILLEQEIEQRIPMPMDELAVVRWIHDMRTEQEDRHGRPAVIIAARRRSIEDRLELFNELGLTLTGLQADNTALVNFVSHEFAEVFATGPELPDQPVGDATVIPSPSDPHSKTPAIVVLDCGAATANLVIVSSETHWMWTGESAGEDLTSKLARVTKTTHAEAEQLKRNPALIESPARQYAPVERRQDETRLRLQAVLADALQQNPRFEVLQSWCVGGGCLAHQWLRRLMTSAAND